MDVTGLIDQLKIQKEKIYMRKSYQILNNLFDKNSFTQIDELSMSYQDLSEIVCGFGAIDGRPVYAFCQDFDTSGGAISKQHISKLKKLFVLARKTGVPVVGIYNSAGLRLLDGELLLIEMGQLINDAISLSKKVPTISVVLGPCLGLNCVLAKSADILIATKDAQASIDVKNTRSICENTLDGDTADVIVNNDAEALNTVRRLLMMLPSNKHSAAPVTHVKEPDSKDFDGFNKVINKMYSCDSYDVKSEVLNMIFDQNSFIERNCLDGQAFCTGLAKLGGVTVGVIASDCIQNNRLIDVSDTKKVSRFIKFCSQFSIPIVSFFDSKEFMSVQGALDFYKAYCMTDVPKFNVVLGELYGVLASIVLSDKCCQSTTVAWPCAKISLLPYKTMASILCNDELKLSDNPIVDRENCISEFKHHSANPLIAAREGFISDVIDPLDTRKKLFSFLELFSAKNVFDESL